MHIIKNIRQSLDFEIRSLLQTITPQETLAEIITAHNTLKDGELATKLEEISSKLPAQLKAELERFGAKLPTDKISLNITLASFLFNLYTHKLETPESPLKRKSLEKKLQDFAAEIDKDEFEIPMWAVKKLVDVFGDEQSLQGVRNSDGHFVGGLEVDAYVKLPEGSSPDSAHTRINWLGARLYDQIQNAAVDALLPYYTEEV